MSKIIRTVRVSGRVLTLGQAERDLRLKEAAVREEPNIDLPRLVNDRVAALRAEFEQEAAQRLKEAVAAVEAEADERLKRAHEAAAAELERTSEERYQEGYQRGLEERESEARKAVEQMEILHGALEQERAQVLLDAEVLVVDLATAVAGRILRTQVDVDRTAVARIVRAALEHLSEHGDVEVLVHPRDLQIARRFCRRWVERVERDAAIRVRASDLVDRGGCMIEAGQENVDARIVRQLDALQQALHADVRGRGENRVHGATGDSQSPAAPFEEK